MAGSLNPYAMPSSGFSFGFPKLPKKVIISYILDYAILIFLFVAFNVLDAIEPFHLPFSLTDKTLAYPFKEKESIPFIAAVAIAIGFPVLVIATFTLIIDGLFSHGDDTVNDFGKERMRGPWDVKQKRRWTKYTIGDRLWELNAGILGLMLSSATAYVTTQVLKNATGKPRPDFLARCQPDSDAKDPKFGLSNSTICHPISDAILKDGFRSFPSGHTSSAFGGLFFLSLYLAGKLHVCDTRGFTWKMFIVGAPTLGAALVGLSRLEDNRHQPFDVEFGAALGVLCAYVAYRQYFPSLQEPWKKGRAYPIRTWGGRNWRDQYQVQVNAAHERGRPYDSESEVTRAPSPHHDAARSQLEDEEKPPPPVERTTSYIAYRPNTMIANMPAASREPTHEEPASFPNMGPHRPSLSNLASKNALEMHPVQSSHTRSASGVQQPASRAVARTTSSARAPSSLSARSQSLSSYHSGISGFPTPSPAAITPFPPAQRAQFVEMEDTGRRGSQATLVQSNAQAPEEARGAHSPSSEYTPVNPSPHPSLTQPTNPSASTSAHNPSPIALKIPDLTTTPPPEPAPVPVPAPAPAAVPILAAHPAPLHTHARRQSQFPIDPVIPKPWSQSQPPSPLDPSQAQPRRHSQSPPAPPPARAAHRHSYMPQHFKPPQDLQQRQYPPAAPQVPPKNGSQAPSQPSTAASSRSSTMEVRPRASTMENPSSIALTTAYSAAIPSGNGSNNGSAVSERSGSFEKIDITSRRESRSATRSGQGVSPQRIARKSTFEMMRGRSSGGA